MIDRISVPYSGALYRRAVEKIKENEILGLKTYV